MRPRALIRRTLNRVLRLDLTPLRLGHGPELDRYDYQRKWLNFSLPPGSRVLDVGSGAYPFPLATHLADRFQGSTTHRHEALIRDHRPFAACDIEALPFRDKAFDYVYCSHLLEHVSSPGRACRELMRVAPRGYIETPTKTSDVLFNFTRLPNHHKWHIHVLGDLLLFLEWKAIEQRDVGTDHFFHEFHSIWANPFQDLVYRNRDLFLNFFQWEDQFRYVVFSADGILLDASAGLSKD
jgi:hypothetical protein